MALKAVTPSCSFPRRWLRKYLFLLSTALLHHSSKFLCWMSLYAQSKYYRRLMNICLEWGSNASATELLETVLWLWRGAQLVPIIMAGFVTWTSVLCELNWDKASKGRLKIIGSMNFVKVYSLNSSLVTLAISRRGSKKLNLTWLFHNQNKGKHISNCAGIHTCPE